MKRRELSKDTERLADDLSEAAKLGIGRAPEVERPAAPPEPDHGAHQHMPFFPMFTRDEKGQVVEIDARTVPLYECEQAGCDDPTHDHSHREDAGGDHDDHDHVHDHGAHDHAHGQGTSTEPPLETAVPAKSKRKGGKSVPG